MLNIYYQVPIIALTQFKLKIKQFQLKKWLRRKNHSIESCRSKWSEKPSMHFLLVCINKNFKNQSLIDAQLMQELSQSPKK